MPSELQNSLIDSHAHLTSSRFAGDVDGVARRAADAGLEAIVSIASDLDDAHAAIALTEQHPTIFATAGVHPHAAEKWDAGSPARLVELAQHDRVVAIGETGLDFYYDNAPAPVQIRSFMEQIEIARSLDLPVVVHSRSADAEMRACIVEAGWERGILHCFSGSRELLDTALDAGWYISFAGMITFPKWDLAELLRRVPLERLLVETDSPYLAPVPFRGKRNEPAHVTYTAVRAADIRGESAAVLATATTANARAVYRLP